MANLSDWIAQASNTTPSAPEWLAAIERREGFSARSPFGAGVVDNSAEHPDSRRAQTGGEAKEDLIARAFAEGEAAGREQAMAEAEETLANQRKFRLSLREFDQAALDSFATDLSETVMALCTQVIAGHTIDSDALIERSRKAAQRIGDVASQCILKLHPDDLALIDVTDLGGLQAESDATLERGSIILEGPDGAVRDGPAEWRRAIAAVLQR